MAEMDATVRIYVEEARELLAELEQALLALEADPDDAERVGACFRAMHTIKGGGAMFGFDEISRFTHDVETVFDRVRSGQIPVTRDLLTLSLKARDHILELLEVPPGEIAPEQTAVSNEMLREFRAFLPQEEGTVAQGAARPTVPAQKDACAGPGAGVQAVYWVRFKPDPDIMLSGNAPLRLIEELGDMGMLRAQSIGRLSRLDDPRFDPERVYLGFDILLLSACSIESLRDVFIFVEGDSEVHVARLREGQMRGSDLDELLAVLEGRGDDPFEELEPILAERTQAKLESIAAARAAARTKASAGAKSGEGAAATLRVESAKLDKLVTMVGELVILQSRLRQAVQAEDNAAAALVDEDLERLTGEMRDIALGVRMLPIGTVFSVFQRLVRDLSGSLSKETDFVAEGGETELDKTVIDRIKDPLIHLLRNSLDHGVETPEERERAGKPRRGTITLTANHSGGSVLITVEDDGKGIDAEAVRRKAVDKGLISAEADLPEKELFGLIFEPGFSTAARVSDVSGRGVGMDVVKRNIEALRGTVELSSKKGEGTKVLIRLPLTLAIIDGFNVLIGRESYIVPLVSLRGFQERFVEGRVRLVDTIERMGELIPLVSLRRLFGVPGVQPPYERVVIVEAEGETVGIAVDRVVGRQQAVIKSLDESYSHLRWLSGTTINGDGSISLILDMPQLVRRAREREDTEYESSARVAR